MIKSNAADAQPKPTTGRTTVLPYVLRDLQDRRAGCSPHSRHLQPGCPRNRARGTRARGQQHEF